VQSAAAQDPGFTIDGVSVARLELPARGFDRARVTAFVGNLVTALQARPDLGIAALTDFEPLAPARIITSIKRPGDGANRSQSVEMHRVSPEYFEVLGIPLIAGRGFAASDAGRDVAIINQTLARQLFDGENPIGRTVLLSTPTEVIGVVRDAATSGVARIDPTFYRPLDATFPPRILLKPRNPAEITTAMQALVHGVDPRVDIKIEPLRASFDRWLMSSRVGAQIAGAVALLALLLAALGVFGVFAFVIQARTPEIGLRMAIGARPAQIIAFVLGSTAWATLGGIAVGLLGAFAGARLLEGQLFGVSPFDPLAYILAASTLALAAGIATYVPARRATRIDPIAALRCD
jgi:ABC-type antimicrobial peptide transport system permease subunit